MGNIDLTTLDWFSAMGWTIIGILFYKAWIYPHGAGFNVKKWFKENIADVIRGLLFTLILVKLGDVVFQLLAVFGIDVSVISEMIKKANLDPIQLSLIASVWIQHVLYKRRKKKMLQLRGVGGENPPDDDEENNA